MDERKRMGRKLKMKLDRFVQRRVAQIKIFRQTRKY